MRTKEPPYDASRGSMAGDGWTVEVRLDDYAQPTPVGDMLVSHQWQRVIFAPAAIGVPSHSEYQSYLGYTRYLSYPAAQALRWWFHAEATKASLALGLRSRLVKHRIRVEHKVEAVSVHCEIGGEDRSAMMPDWGKPETPVLIESQETDETKSEKES